MTRVILPDVRSFNARPDHATARKWRSERAYRVKAGFGPCKHCGEQMRHGECPFCEPELGDER